ncbi:apoptosis regulator BAX-like [Glandiceps talaboti]
MAEGGPPGGDEQDGHYYGAGGGIGRQRSQEDDIGAQAARLLADFIVDRFNRDGVANAPRADEIQDDNIEAPMIENWQQVGATLRVIADEMDQDFELQRMIERVPTNTTVDAVIAVARVIFDDGVVNWGRVVALFYFAYRMCARAVDNVMAEYLPEWMRKLIKEIVKILVEVFAAWIISRGGWGAIVEYLGSPAWQFYGLCALSVSCLIAAFFRMRWQ